MIGITGYVFKTMFNKMVIEIWKCAYESGLGTMVN